MPGWLQSYCSDQIPLEVWLSKDTLNEISKCLRKQFHRGATRSDLAEKASISWSRTLPSLLNLDNQTADEIRNLKSSEENYFHPTIHMKNCISMQHFTMLSYENKIRLRFTYSLCLIWDSDGLFFSPSATDLQGQCPLRQFFLLPHVWMIRALHPILWTTCCYTKKETGKTLSTPSLSLIEWRCSTFRKFTFWLGNLCCAPPLLSFLNCFPLIYH